MRKTIGRYIENREWICFTDYVAEDTDTLLYECTSTCFANNMTYTIWL